MKCMPKHHSFRDLKVWQQSMTLVQDIYRLTKQFPREERFGLTAQIRRAAISIPSNIGEGKRRRTDAAFLNHLDIALGSQGEVEVQLEIAMLLGFLKPSDYHKVQPMVEEIGRMLNGLIDAIEPSAKR
jgi:four helix bundle protein